MNEIDKTPRQIVAELDKYVIGQDSAKRAIAVALRNRYRRMQLPKDMQEDISPKNLLMIGPTGVGKTEVAMRAIFKAVMSGKQVAVLVPTTVLAQQHFQTFLNRFAPFGVKVDVLNRFRSTAEKKQVLKGVEDGSIDVLIGTHSLLNKKVVFKDLGMLVVDEEQRFGVAQKEKWKEWASNIDVLTLSATPIPRSLHTFF